jgi:hypothetical protein
MKQPQLGMPDNKNKSTIMMWLIQKNGIAMYVFSRKSLYKTESTIFQLKFYSVKDYLFMKLKINMVDSF